MGARCVPVASGSVGKGGGRPGTTLKARGASSTVVVPDPAQDASAADPDAPAAERDPVDPALDIKRLSKKDQEILALRKTGMSQQKIADQVGLSRTAIRKHIDALIMRGFLNPDNREEENEEQPAGPSASGTKAIVTNRALGAATAEAARKGAEIAVETTDVFYSTGEWAWRKFNEAAREAGYDDIFAWLGDCVTYWETERRGWQTVLDDVRDKDQELEVLRARVEALMDVRALRREILEAVMLSNLSGCPMTGEQLQVLVTGRASVTPPAPEIRTLATGRG